MEIVLKSSSPRRKELLEKMGYEFEIKVYPVDETVNPELTPFENVQLIAYKKASVNKEEDENKVLIGCDTIVVVDDEIYGKPKDALDAKRMLKSLSGRAHQVMSGLTVIYGVYEWSYVDISEVFFKELSDDDIDSYIATGECFGKAGSYAIQGLGGKLVDHYEGSLNNIIGLPTEMLEEILGEINEL